MMTLQRSKKSIFIGKEVNVKRWVFSLMIKKHYFTNFVFTPTIASTRLTLYSSEIKKKHYFICWLFLRPNYSIILTLSIINIWQKGSVRLLPFRNYNIGAHNIFLFTPGFLEASCSLSCFCTFVVFVRRFGNSKYFRWIRWISNTLFDIETSMELAISFF